MKRSVWAIALMVGATPLATAAAATPKAEITAGRDVAQNVCAACHKVADQQEFQPILAQPAPAFQVIADDPRTTAQSLRRFITGTHWDEKSVPISMPNPMLTSDQARDVATYIMSLRTQTSTSH